MTVSSEMSQWLAIWLPRLSTDRLRRAANAPAKAVPLVVYARQVNAFALVGVDSMAEKCGLRPGMSLADARAMQPAMVAVEADAAADERLLDGIAAWCERYGPIVVLDAPDGLFLEIGGSAHLFGGGAGLLTDIERRLALQSVSASCAIGPTTGAAWALARWKAGSIASASDVAAQLDDLPVAALRLEEATALFLHRAGLKTIGQLIAAPRSVFAARAGEKAMRKLDQVLGHAREALTPRRPPPPVFAQRRLVEPVFHAEAVLKIAETLIRDVLVQLERRDAGLKSARFILFGVDSRDRVITIGASRPERDVRALLRLFREKLNRMSDDGQSDLAGEFGFELARLEVTALERVDRPAEALSQALASDEAACATRMAALIDVLSARLGAGRVTRPVLVDAHQPERQGVWRPALSSMEVLNGASARASKDGVLRRPLSLFKRPQPITTLSVALDGPPISFQWRRITRKIRRAEGPERITPDWLKADDTRTRDYFRAEDDTGRRYWVFREGDFGGETPPKWFIHGLFP